MGYNGEEVGKAATRGRVNCSWAAHAADTAYEVVTQVALRGGESLSQHRCGGTPGRAPQDKPVHISNDEIDPHTPSMLGIPPAPASPRTGRAQKSKLIWQPTREDIGVTRGAKALWRSTKRIVPSALHGEGLEGGEWRKMEHGTTLLLEWEIPQKGWGGRAVVLRA